MNTPWSERIADAFSLQRSPDLIAWFDEGLFRDEKFDSESPEDILSTGGVHAVWAGQMLSDSFPIFGDGGGDSCCLRFDPQGAVREIGWWSHEGGGWIPWASSLLEWLPTSASSPDTEAALWGQHYERAKETARDDGDWGRAAEHANAVLKEHTDLAWPYLILARWSAEEGRPEESRAYALEAVLRPKITQGFMAMEERNRPLLRPLRQEAFTDPYLQAFAARRVREYWIAQAEIAEREGRFADAYRSYFFAGWDDFFTNEMDVILESLARTAHLAGWTPLAKLAAHHRACWRGI